MENGPVEIVDLAIEIVSTLYILYPLDPSGKRLHNYGKIHHYHIIKSTISKAIFNSKLLNYQRVYQNLFFKIYFLG